MTYIYFLIEQQPYQYQECDNCHRRNVPTIPQGSFYDIQFHIRSSNNISRWRTFKHVRYNQSNPVNYTFCTECNYYLSPDHNANTKYDSSVWCSFIWSLFANTNIQNVYGIQIWKFIPIEWRPWWIHSITTLFPTIYSNTITIEYPTPVFKDKTIDIKEWNDDINSYLLSRLATASNKFLRPSIKCPWGCSEFQHKVGYLPLDIIFQRILQKCSFNMFTNSNLNLQKNVVSIREDYIREHDDEDMLFFNPEWKVLPSLAFVTGKGPMILTCNEHDGGTKLFMVHPCRWKHNLPARKPDQLCQAVMQPRVLRPMKASKYSTSFQMFHQSGTFNGIDTCSATNYGNFDFSSKLTAEAEARSITNRPDINAHLSKLREENVISKYTELGRRDFAARFSRSIDYSRFVIGGTYVSLEASISLQNENTSRIIKALLDHRNTNPVRLSFNKYWSECLYPCQTMTLHGVIFPKLPKFANNNIDTRLIWTVATLLSRVEALWQIVTKVDMKTSQWHGWMLVYLTKHCFNEGGRRQSRVDPFKLSFINTIVRLHEKTQQADLRSYFHDLNGVLFVDFSTDDDGKFNLVLHIISPSCNISF